MNVDSTVPSVTSVKLLELTSPMAQMMSPWVIPATAAGVVLFWPLTDTEECKVSTVTPLLTVKLWLLLWMIVTGVPPRPCTLPPEDETVTPKTGMLPAATVVDDDPLVVEVPPPVAAAVVVVPDDLP